MNKIFVICRIESSTDLPFRELIPVDAEVNINISSNKKPIGVHLLISGKKPVYEIKNARPDDPVGRGRIYLEASQIMDHEIIAVEFG